MRLGRERCAAVMISLSVDIVHCAVSVGNDDIMLVGGYCAAVRKR